MGLMGKFKKYTNKLKIEKEKRIELEQKELRDRNAMLDLARSGRCLKPINNPTGIILHKGEYCYLACPAQRYESKNMVVGHTGGYGGGSVRIAKGFSVHMGRTRSQPIRQNVGLRYSGAFYVTNKRLFFIGDKKNFSIPWSSLLGVKEYSNAVDLQTSRITYTIIPSPLDFACALLQGCIKNFAQ